MAAVGRYVLDDAPAPLELMDVTLAERFGWTFTELDEQDMSRVLPAVAAANIHSAVRRVQTWMETAGRGQKVGLPSETDLRLYSEVQLAMKDTPPHA